MPLARTRFQRAPRCSCPASQSGAARIGGPFPEGLAGSQGAAAETPEGQGPAAGLSSRARAQERGACLLLALEQTGCDGF